MLMHALQCLRLCSISAGKGRICRSTLRVVAMDTTLTKSAECPEKPPLDCPAAHGLQERTTPEPGRVCDICDETVKPGCEAFACEACGFDVCQRCMDQRLSKADLQIDKMKTRISNYAKRAPAYADEAKQAKARALVPAALLAMSRSSVERELLLQLLKWFKSDFFDWLDSPFCEKCSVKAAKSEGMAQPTESELEYGATRVEAWRCEGCDTLLRFPRYDDPVRLLETRQGRCGEWANCFTLIAAALGYKARLVVDWTDHVWTEVWYQDSWHHCDPCEACLDAPLTYEVGWGKKLTYILAFGQHEVVDVTARYTRSWDAVLSRRTLLSEEELSKIIEAVDSSMQAGLPVPAWRKQEEAELQRRKAEGAGALSLAELSGRTSGSADWRAERGELGATLPLQLSAAYMLLDPSQEFKSEVQAQLSDATVALHSTGVRCLELRTPLAAAVVAPEVASPDAFLCPEGFTVESWVAASEEELQPLAHANPLVSRHGPASGWELRLCANGAVVFLVTIDGVHYELQSTQCCEWRGQWIHVAGTFDGEVSRVFVGKELVGELRVAGGLLTAASPKNPSHATGHSTPQGAQSTGSTWRQPAPRPLVHARHSVGLRRATLPGQKSGLAGPRRSMLASCRAYRAACPVPPLLLGCLMHMASATCYVVAEAVLCFLRRAALTAKDFLPAPKVHGGSFL